MMKHLLPFLLLFFIGCKSTKIDYAAQGYTKAIVIKYEVESCGYLLQLDDENKLMPQELTEEFKKDGLQVWIKYEILKKQPMTTCMAGKSIKLTDIKKR